MEPSSRPEIPARLSALYQYHNAPEVAPAHGLEYDDTIYPSSDKYPVIREREYDGNAFGGDNRPPRIIFGMKVRTFLMVAAVMTLIVVGAAVGGAVGGQQLRNQQMDNFSANGTDSPISGSTSSPNQTAGTHTTFSAPIPTYTALSDCPDSNHTKYISQFSTMQTSSGSSPNKAGLRFTKFCDKQNPLNLTGALRFAEAFVYSFSDCVEICAGYNFWSGGTNCTVAVYQPLGVRPGNCWVGHASNVQASHLNEADGIDVALLNS